MSLKEELLTLLEKDRELRYAVAGLIGLTGILERLEKHEAQLTKLYEELVKLREDFNKHEAQLVKLREDFNRHEAESAKRFQAIEEHLKRHDQELVRLREDMVEGFKRHDQELVRLREDMAKGFELVNRHISALGARWGLLTEEAFREGLKGLIEKELGLKVERWIAYDDQGLVYGYPCPVEVDVAIHDEKATLIEVKAHVGAPDIQAFKRKAEFYEKATGKRPYRLIVVTPYADEKALQAAKHLNVEVYTKV